MLKKVVIFFIFCFICNNIYSNEKVYSGKFNNYSFEWGYNLPLSAIKEGGQGAGILVFFGWMILPFILPDIGFKFNYNKYYSTSILLSNTIINNDIIDISINNKWFYNPKDNFYFGLGYGVDYLISNVNTCNNYNRCKYLNKKDTINPSINTTIGLKLFTKGKLFIEYTHKLIYTKNFNYKIHNYGTDRNTKKNHILNDGAIIFKLRWNF